VESFTEIWEMVRKKLKENVSDMTYDLWLAKLEPVEFDDDHAVLMTSEFKRMTLEKKFMDILNTAFYQVLGFDIPITVISDSAENTGDKKTKAAEPPLLLQTFETFVVGPQNKFAHTAALSVAEKPGKEYNPLFIYGHSGLGKTHLMQAILHRIKTENPSVKAISTKGEAFTNELLHHLGQQNMSVFHNKYRNIDILLVDDVQFIGGKVSTQEEFFHTFNEVTMAGGQIVLTSDRPPKDIATLDERLRTRFEMGLIADIQPPDFETRIVIVKRKAQDMNTSFPEEICYFIADKLRSNVRQLEGAARRMQAYIALNGMEPTRATAELAIRDILEEAVPAAVTIEKIVEEIARAFNGEPEVIRGKKRDAKTVMMRQAAIYCARQVTSLSMQQIGREFGRDHSTVNHSLRQMDTELKRNAQVRAIVNDVLSNIRE